MKLHSDHAPPVDASARKGVAPVVCYPIPTLPKPDLASLVAAQASARLISTVDIPPRDARTFDVKAGQFFRVVSIDGPQVGDLNLFNASDPGERFYSGKTRALHGTHMSTGDQMWSSFPHLRPLATVTCDTLDWYGYDDDGGGVHDVIGTRCDPYTQRLLGGVDYHNCCHSNLTRAMAERLERDEREVEGLVHDVLNVFMCTGFTRDTHQYFMKASPVRPGDYIEFFAEIDLIGALSACPGGDCGSEHSSDTAACHPLRVEVYDAELPVGWESPAPSQYHWPDQ